MSEFDSNDFLDEKRRAIERMRELNRQSAFKDTPHKMPPAPSFVKVTGSPAENRGKFDESLPPVSRNHNRPKHEKRENRHTRVSNRTDFPFFSSSGIPLLSGLKGDGDTALILGLILLLASENSDRSLLLALLYILM